MKPVNLILLFSSLFLFAPDAPSQVPSVGDSTQLEIANWNLEWFGKSGYGPSDEVLQQSNVLNVIQKADIDIWTFCEVSDIKVFDSMMLKLPEYSYTICNYLPEQKTAVIFKKKQFGLISSGLIGTDNPDSFTTLRYPFQVMLKPLIPMGIDTLCLIALHLKANFGTGAELLSAYNSRLRSGEWLKMYLNKYHTKHYCMVLGDWNDDLDESIYNGLPSPYAALQDTDFKFSFLTRKFTDNHTGTTTSYPDAIDHQLISMPLQSYFVQNSTKIFYLNQYITAYASTTSDHYPVYSSFKRKSSGVYNYKENNKFYLYPNPAVNKFKVQSDEVIENGYLKIINMQGVCVMEDSFNSAFTYSIENLPSGYYQIVITDNTKCRSGLLNIIH